MRLVLGLGPIGPFVRRHPRRQRGRGFRRRIQLPQNNADAGTSEAIVGDGNSGRICSRRYRGDHPLLERDRLGISKPAQYVLERLVPRGVKCPRLPNPVLRGMSRIEMRARDPAVGDRLGRRMSAAMLQQLRQHVGVGPFGLRPLGGGIG